MAEDTNQDKSFMQKIREAMIQKEVDIFQKKQTQKAKDEMEYMVLMINRLLCESYPAHLQQYVKMNVIYNFGHRMITKEVKNKLRMYDGLNLNQTALQPINCFLQEYLESDTTPKTAKHGKSPAEVNCTQMQFLYIQYMLLKDEHGNLEEFIDTLPFLLSFNARFFEVLNADPFTINTASIIKDLKQSVNAFHAFATSTNRTRLNGVTNTKATLTENNNKWDEIKSHIGEVLVYKNVVRYNIDGTRSASVGAILDDYQALTIDNPVIIQVMQQFIDALTKCDFQRCLKLLGRLQTLVKMSVLIISNQRFEVVPYLLKFEFDNAYYDEETKCYLVKFYEHKNQRHKDYIYVPFPEVLYHVQKDIIHKILKVGRYVFVTHGYYKGELGLWPQNASKTLRSLKQWLRHFVKDAATLNSLARVTRLHKVREATHIRSMSAQTAAYSNHSARTAVTHYGNHREPNDALKREEFKGLLRYVLAQTKRNVDCYSKDNLNTAEALRKLELIQTSGAEVEYEGVSIDEDYDSDYERYERDVGDERDLLNTDSDDENENILRATTHNYSNADEQLSDISNSSTSSCAVTPAKRRRVIVSSDDEEATVSSDDDKATPCAPSAGLRRSFRLTKLQEVSKNEREQIMHGDKYSNRLLERYFINSEKGNGVRAKQELRNGQYLCDYRGEMITVDEGIKRHRHLYTATDGSYIYFCKTRNPTNGKLYQFCVDATADKSSYGIGKFFNHSTHAPNCKVVLSWIGNHPKLFVVALRDISAGEELTFDYGERDPKILAELPFLKNA